MSDSKKRGALDKDDLIAMIADSSTGPDMVMRTEDGRNLAAVLLGHKGGLKGGAARASKLSQERRSEIAKKAALSRWAKEENKSD